jgi:hypothetical protein
MAIDWTKAPAGVYSSKNTAVAALVKAVAPVPLRYITRLPGVKDAASIGVLWKLNATEAIIINVLVDIFISKLLKVKNSRNTNTFTTNLATSRIRQADLLRLDRLTFQR